MAALFAALAALFGALAALFGAFAAIFGAFAAVFTAWGIVEDLNVGAIVGKKKKGVGVMVHGRTAYFFINLGDDFQAYCGAKIHGGKSPI